MRVIIVGYGGRGRCYAKCFTKYHVEIASVCDTDKKRLKYAVEELGIDKSKTYSCLEDMKNSGIQAKLCVIATPDAQHKKDAILALSMGYDLLLEKPITTNIEDCIEIMNLAKKLKRKVFICHVLRYAPFFNLIKKELNTGKYGKISTINLTENVSYWHQAHSFVRGNWRNSISSSPMIVAKSCHDLDIIAWLMESKCLAVSSMGGLNLYRPQNAPKGAADRCVNCKVEGCEYNAVEFYIEKCLKKQKKTGWPVNVLAHNPTEKNVYDALQTSDYGICVYKCDNNVVDHQVVNMLFEENRTAHLTMTAFSEECYRHVHIHGERGEIFGSMEDGVLHCKVYAKESFEIDTSKFADGEFGHGGGDELLIKDIVNIYKNSGNSLDLTTIENSMESHIIGFNAEKSRLESGTLIRL